MPKKFEIEVFKDAVFPELDSDEIAHALATIEVIKPYVEIINRNRKLKLGEAHGATELDRSKRIRVPLDSDIGVLYTGRHISGDPEDKEGTRITGVYIGNSKLCVVSTDSSSVATTARHELGHSMYGLGIEAPTMDEVTGHCSAKGCIMQAFVEYERKPIRSTPMRRMAESMGLRAARFENIIKSVDFCSGCSDALRNSANVRALMKENEIFGRSVLASYLAQQN